MSKEKIDEEKMLDQEELEEASGGFMPQKQHLETCQRCGRTAKCEHSMNGTFCMECVRQLKSQGFVFIY